MAHIEVDHIRQALSWMQPGDVIELRALGVKVKHSYSPRTVSGYFDSIEAMIPLLERMPDATGVYVTLNPVLPACLARAANRMVTLNDRDSRTSDHDVARRVWFPIDCDPIRPKGISSTDAEWQLAVEKATAIASWLQARGWPEPTRCHSGNGMHLLYRVDLPNDEQAKTAMQRALQALAFVHDDAQVLVDQTNFNAARIWKLYGTIARKGDDLVDRPNRMSRILSGVPGDPICVSLTHLEAIGNLLPQDDPSQRRGYQGRRDFDLEQWIADYAAEVIGPESWQRGGRRWRFPICPWNEDHRDRSAYIVELASGAIAAGCHHNGCTGNDWAGLRSLREPPKPIQKPAQPRATAPTYASAQHARVESSPASKSLYGVGDIVGEKLIWVTSKEEKEMVRSAGYRSCVAVPDIPPIGADYRQSMSYLTRLEETFKPIKQHILLMPNTLDGRAFLQELARRLGPEYARQALWPMECETVEHILKIYDLEVLQETIETVQPLPLPDVIEMNDLRQSLHDWYAQGGLPPGISPGWESLRQIYRISKGRVTLITGVPSTGKSSLVSAMLINLMRQHKWVVTIFSPEQAPATRYGSTLVKQWVQKPFDKGPTPRMTEEELDRAIDALQDRVTLLWPEEEEPTVSYLLEKARQEVFRRGIDGFVIDPWDEVTHIIGQDGREDLYIGRSLTQIRRFARLYNVHVWVVAHPRQFTSSTEAPGGYDISGGAKWRNKADNILGLRRDLSGPKESILEVHTAKIRFREDGQLGRQADLAFNWPAETYSDPSPTADWRANT